MPQTPKTKPQNEREILESNVPATLEEDQPEHSYYYDDAHGYELYNPEEDDKEEESVRLKSDS